MSKAAMKLALGKIKAARDCHFKAIDPLLFEAEEILEAALAEKPAQQEPVAKYIGEGSEGSLVQLYEDVKKGTDFYTSPPAQRSPLTDEDIEEIAARTLFPVAFARAIEDAHGIKEQS